MLTMFVNITSGLLFRTLHVLFKEPYETPNTILVYAKLANDQI